MRKTFLNCSLTFGLMMGTALTVSGAAAFAKELALGGIGADVGQLDPHFATSTSDRTVVGWVFNGLVRFPPGSTNPDEIEGDLAESWEASEDHLVWTFKLRPDVKWQKGYGTVSAEDVVFSLEKARTAETSAFAVDYGAIDKIEAVDPTTVRISLSRSVPSVLGLLANYAGGYIVPKKAVEELGADFTRNPVGSGPFMIEAVESGVGIKLVRHGEYFRGEPKIESVDYRFMPANSARDLAFESGELHAVAGVQNQKWLERAQSLDGAKVDVFEPAELLALYIDSNKPPMNDIRVRQAIAHAIDTTTFVKFQGESFTRIPTGVIPSNNLGFVPVDMPEFNLERAKELLAEAGYPDGIKIEMVASQMPVMENTTNVLQALLKKANIELDLKPVEHAAWHQQIRQDVNAMTVYGAARFPVADFYLSQFFDGPAEIGSPTQITNFSHCKVADAQIAAARVEPDAEKQLALWKEAQELIAKELCSVPLSETMMPWLRTEKLDWGYDFKGSLTLGPVLTENTVLND